MSSVGMRPAYGSHPELPPAPESIRAGTHGRRHRPASRSHTDPLPARTSAGVSCPPSATHSSAMVSIVQPMKAKSAAAILVSAVVLCGPALSNRYPFVYEDTTRYLRSGLELRVPGDRPIHYGLFLRCASLLGSGWFVVFVQALTVAALLFVGFRRVARVESPGLATLVASGLLILSTGLGIHVGYLIPDVFSGVMLLAAALILASERLPLGELVFLSTVTVISAGFHLSNLPTLTVVALLAAVMWVLARVSPSLPRMAGSRVAVTAALAAFAWIFVGGTHAIFGGGFRLSRSAPVFLAGRMVENGLMERVLAEHCGERRWRLCAYRAELPHDNAGFIWDQHTSPFYKTGSWSDENVGELLEIIRASLASPRLFARHVERGLEQGLVQLFEINAGTWLASMAQDEGLLAEIRRAFPLDVNGYLTSDQSTSRIDVRGLNFMQRLVVGLSALALAYVLFGPSRRTINSGMLVLVCALAAGVVVNAFVSGALASPLDRYQSRVIWLLPLAVLLLVVNAFPSTWSHSSYTDRAPSRRRDARQTSPPHERELPAAERASPAS
jgi:hypothetical protein